MSLPSFSPQRFSYLGCFNGTSGLSGYKWTDWSKMTVELCTKGCKELGYSLSSLNSATVCLSPWYVPSDFLVLVRQCVDRWTSARNPLLQPQLHG